MLSRRDLLRWLALSGAYAAVPSSAVALGFAAGCGKSSGDSNAPVLDDGEKRDLGVLADAVIPPDPGSPGGKDMGAVVFIERLLTSPMLVFAGGPFSGRQPFGDDHGGASTNVPPNEFVSFVELDRVHAAAWKLRVEGGAPPNADLVPPNPGLRAEVKALIDDARKSAAPKALTDLDEAGRADMLKGMDAANRDLVIDLVTQACFSAPEYGGNVGLAGWKLCNFEGDSQPLGYSIFDTTTNTYKERPDAPMSGPNPGPDPAPLDDDTKSVVSTAIQLEGGKVFF